MAKAALSVVGPRFPPDHGWHPAVEALTFLEEISGVAFVPGNLGRNDTIDDWSPAGVRLEQSTNHHLNPAKVVRPLPRIKNRAGIK